jgi:hypothetical protein
MSLIVSGMFSRDIYGLSLKTARASLGWSNGSLQDE